MTIRLSDLTRAGLENIRVYTIRTWGRTQWLIYCRQIVCTFERIAEIPQIGTGRNLFVSGMRSINCKKRLSFFKCLDTADGAPVVFRIVLGRQHMPALVCIDDLNGMHPHCARNN